MTTTESEGKDSFWQRPGISTMARLVGVVLFAVVSWLYLASGLLAPMWAVGLLWLIWAVFLVILIRSWRSRPWVILALPFLAYLLWVGVMLLGDVLLGWTA
jgi:hypothetical protein